MAEAAQKRELVLGRYRPLRPLGTGGSGSVWLARDERSGLDVSLKIVPREGKAASRAEREVEAAMRLRHPHCQRAYALEYDSSHVYIAYEYVPGRTLRQAMRAGELRDAHALEAAAQTLDALAHAHARGVVHRDVKPANILLAESAEIAVKLLDFGLAQIAEADSLTATGDVPGTLAYISPERLRGSEGGPASDVWAVGVLLWEALVGRHPFWGASVAETARLIAAGAPPLATMRPDLPRHVLAAVDAALSLDPARRPSAAELAGELRRPLRERLVLPKHKGSDGAFRLPRRLWRSAAAGAIGVASGWAAQALPFFPEGWPLGIAGAVALISALRLRIGLALALAVPVLPLGNLALGAALAYAAIVAALLVALAAAPAAGRRALAAAAAALGVAVAAGVDTSFAAERSPLLVAQAVAGALPTVVYALAALLAIVAAALPPALARGRWGIAVLGAVPLAAAAFPTLPALPLVAGAWILCLGLWLQAES